MREAIILVIASQGAETEQPVRLLFERMFGMGSPGERKWNLQRRGAQQKSILDYVLDDVASLSGGANPGDRRKIDQYLTALRDIEQRIQKAERRFDQMQDPRVETPAGIPTDYAFRQIASAASVKSTDSFAGWIHGGQG